MSQQIAIRNTATGHFRLTSAPLWSLHATRAKMKKEIGRRTSPLFSVQNPALTSFSSRGGRDWNPERSSRHNRQSLAMRKIRFGSVILSPVTGERFRIADMLGEGGFGCAYRIERLDSRDRSIEEHCLKTTNDPQSWHQEAYFGELLKSCERAIHMYESFPLFPPTKRHEVLYCLVFELAAHGTIRDHLASTKRSWSFNRASREIIALLKLLNRLHGVGALHRDITPMNVFVCNNKRLKLGDFGIARQVLPGNLANASVFNRGFVSRRMAKGEQRNWLPSDDVFQMGQLFAMLLHGDPDTLISGKDVKSLPCNDDLKEIIAKAICPRKSRYPNALEMLRELQGDGDYETPTLDDLEGKTVVFTGPLSIRRFDAEVLVRQVGGQVASHVTNQVDVLVQGGRSPRYSKGHKGDKLCAVEKLIRQGHPISLISENEFFNLVHFR